MVEKYINPIGDDNDFRKNEEVRSKTLELFSKVLSPWEGQTKDSIFQVVNNKAIEAEKCAEEEENRGWFTWFQNSFEAYFDTAFCDDDQMISGFEPDEEDQEKLIFLLFKDFYARMPKEIDKKLLTAYEMALIKWEDFVWFLNWILENEEKIPNYDVETFGNVPPGSPEGDDNYLLKPVIQYILDNFVNSADDKMKQAIASRFGTMLSQWIK